MCIPTCTRGESTFRVKYSALNNSHRQGEKKENLLTAVEQEVVVELFQGVPHIVRHGTLFILQAVLEVGQQKHLDEEPMT